MSRKSSYLLEGPDLREASSYPGSWQPFLKGLQKVVDDDIFYSKASLSIRHPESVAQIQNIRVAFSSVLQCLLLLFSIHAVLRKSTEGGNDAAEQRELLHEYPTTGKFRDGVC